MEAFSIELVLPEGSSTEGRIAVGRTFGASTYQSVDGSAQVFLLGTSPRGMTARQLTSQDLATTPPAPVVDSNCAAVVILNLTHGSASVWMPSVGRQQVFWAGEARKLTVASEPKDLAAPTPSGHVLSSQAIFNYLYHHMVPSPHCVFSGVAKLAPGHVLHWSGGEPSVRRYWRPAMDNNQLNVESEARSELLALLTGAVRDSLSNCASAGTFLSGGLDSSTVTGLAARERDAIPSISMGFDADGYDEMQFARAASRHFGSTPIEYYVTPEDVVSSLPAIAAAFPEPFGNSSAAAAFHCARIARQHGLQRLLAGDGGDELFGGNERYASQMVFERYLRLPMVIRRSVIEPSVAAVTRLTTAYPFGKARSYIEKANIPLPDRLQSYNFLHRHDPSEIFESAVLESVDTSEPLRLLREEYAVPGTTSPVNRMLFMDWKFTLYDNDLVKVNTMCRLAGVDVAYPMLDQRLVEFSMRLPADWKVHNGELRWFYKRAVQGLLPDQIIRKSKHGFGLPFGVWTRRHGGLRRMAEDALGSLSARGFFRPAFLQEALRLHMHGHASYYGELVWILMVLELWLQAHVPEARA